MFVDSYVLGLVLNVNFKTFESLPDPLKSEIAREGRAGSLPKPPAETLRHVPSCGSVKHTSHAPRLQAKVHS